MAFPFKDRIDAGRQLAAELREYAGRSDVVVLALPRGGVPVAYEVARALQLPLDVFLVRKLGAPAHEELAMGAIATGGVRVLNEDVVRMFGIPPQRIDEVASREQRELERRESAYRRGRPRVSVSGKTVILIDDGLATGSSMRAAVRALRHAKPARIVIAVPTAAPETCNELRAEADEIICATLPPLASHGFGSPHFVRKLSQPKSARRTDGDCRDRDTASPAFREYTSRSGARSSRCSL